MLKFSFLPPPSPENIDFYLICPTIVKCWVLLLPYFFIEGHWSACIYIVIYTLDYIRIYKNDYKNLHDSIISLLHFIHWQNVFLENKHWNSWLLKFCFLLTYQHPTHFSDLAHSYYLNYDQITYLSKCFWSKTA